ncbi:hypothetical protein GQ43DRAFT_75367 [Delitschia confertaspora ATCC 74209]|uniref:Uncharacterized protein n=1 Tax=Delitschia confertaspora ATCC 74209 TaxID=1513339 RepID=A0A9P4MVT7_9PLEO|nr:hypothetical protein GQ43DRAFT_75367 [Delitschia confertaspora ATCC 74209]
MGDSHEEEGGGSHKDITSGITCQSNFLTTLFSNSRSISSLIFGPATTGLSSAFTSASATICFSASPPSAFPFLSAAICFSISPSFTAESTFTDAVTDASSFLLNSRMSLLLLFRSGQAQRYGSHRDTGTQ